MSTYIHEPEATHKMCVKPDAEAKSSSVSHEIFDAEEPRSSLVAGDAEEMNCANLYDAAGDKRLSNLDFRLLALFSRGYAVVPTRREFAEMAGCSMSSVPRAARKLEGLGYIERAKSDPKGKAAPTRYGIYEDTRIVEDTVAQDTAQDVVAVEPKRQQSAASRIVEDTVSAPPPTTPSKNKTPLPLEKEEEVCFALNGDNAPKRRSRRKPKLVATDETMPREPTRKMLEHAAENKFYNGTVERMFAKWRDHHISRGTEIADYEASWRTWVSNAIDFRDRDEAKATRGAKPAGVGPDGLMRYNRKRSYYVGQ